jgi:hypothetical protein
MGRHEAEVSRQETETARQEGEWWRRQLENQPKHERQTGGEESANKKQRRGGVSRGHEAAARREASRQPAGKREANSGGIETFKPDESFFRRSVECGESEVPGTLLGGPPPPPTRARTAPSRPDARRRRRRRTLVRAEASYLVAPQTPTKVRCSRTRKVPLRRPLSEEATRE